MFEVQSHTMWPYMCMCCGLFVPTQFHFECCGVRDGHVKIYIQIFTDIEICERIRICISICICKCIFMFKKVYIFRDLESVLSKTKSVWT